MTKNPHLKGDDREQVRQQLADRYLAGDTIRGLADSTGRGYGTIRPAAFAGPSGYLFGIQQLRPGTDPADMWAARFIVAYANRDSANTLALFETALKASTEEYVGSVAALVTTVTGLIVAATGGPGE